MAIQFDVATRNARADAIESTTGTTPTLEIRTGSPPANCATADSGSVLATITLPSDWMAAAASGVKAMSGSWQVAASGTGTAGHFRIKSSGGGTVRMQGTCGQGSGDLSLDNTSIVAAQTVTVSGFTITEGNA